MYSGDGHGSNYKDSHYGPGGQYGGKLSQEKVTIQVPNDTVGLIIGKGIHADKSNFINIMSLPIADCTLLSFLGGETVKTLQQQSGAKIQIESDHGPTTADRNVHIIGKCTNNQLF